MALAVCGAPATSQVSSPARTLQDPALPGSRPGTYRYIVVLNGRGFDLAAQLRGIRGGADEAVRTQGLAGLRQMVLADQASVVQLVGANGGTVRKSYWVSSSLAVEIPLDAVAAITAHPRVRRLVPVRSRGSATITPIEADLELPVPQTNAEDRFNHNVDAARNIIQAAYLANPNGAIPAGAYRGAGVRVAVLDTGLDENGGGVSGTPGPHDAFKDAAGQSRIDLHALCGTPQSNPDPIGGDVISCNIIAVGGGVDVGPSLQNAFRSCRHSGSAFHGTGMASIIAGRAHTAGNASHVDGHAPDARLIDIAITEVPTAMWGATRRDIGVWTTADDLMLNAVETLRDWILQTSGRIHVLNVSFDGWSDPTDPVSVALDEFALDEDVILVASAGNLADDTRLSHGFYNGLAVGAVHARVEADQVYTAIGVSAHGPLASDPTRFYPDVCATGAGPGRVGDLHRYRNAQDRTHPWNSVSYLRLPRIDSRDGCSLSGSRCDNVLPPCGGTFGVAPFAAPVPSDIYLAQGTSEAAPQVAGAAALYRATRPQADAQETRAALLLNVASAMPGSFGGSPPTITGNDQSTYSNRNAYGVGYVRDDFVAEFAVRDPSIAPYYSLVQLSGGPGQPAATASYVIGPIHTPGRYAVVCAWPKRNAIEGDTLVNVDMEVREAGNTTNVLARSRSRGNSYERVAFTLSQASIPPAGAQFEILVQVAEGGPMALGLPVTIVARRFEPDFDPDASAPGVQFTSVHASTGAVDVVQAGVGETNCMVGQTNCAASAPVVGLLGTVPSVYSTAWGSGPLTRPSTTSAAGFYEYLPPLHRGLNLNGPRPILSGQTQPWNFHVEYGAGVLPIQGSVSVSSISFRTWSPLRCAGDITITGIWMESTSSSAVTTSSLQRAIASATAVRSTPYLLAAPPRTTSGLIDTVAERHDSFTVDLPLEVPFTVQPSSNLHIWVACVGAQLFEVDSAADGAGSPYGIMIGNSAPGGTFFTLIGNCPILNLEGGTSAQFCVRPQLETLGEPTLGRSMEVHGRMFSPGATFRLYFGDWAPSIAQLGSCWAHIVPNGSYFDAIASPNGTIRWAMQSTPGVPLFPLDPVLLSREFGFQAMDMSTGLLSSAIRLHVGGGL